MFILRRLRGWSVRKLVVVCFGWLAACILAPIAYVAAMLFFQPRTSGSGGIGAVSAGCVEPFVVAFGPIAVLVALWIVAKRTADAPTLP